MGFINQAHYVSSSSSMCQSSVSLPREPPTHLLSPTSLQMFVTEVNSHRDHIIDLDQTGTHLKYFSQKQDVVLIKNLLLSVQGRWEKLVQRSVERGRQLDDARKRAKQVGQQAQSHCCLRLFISIGVFWWLRPV